MRATDFMMSLKVLKQAKRTVFLMLWRSIRILELAPVRPVLNFFSKTRSVRALSQ